MQAHWLFAPSLSLPILNSHGLSAEKPVAALESLCCHIFLLLSLGYRLRHCEDSVDYIIIIVSVCVCQLLLPTRKAPSINNNIIVVCCIIMAAEAEVGGVIPSEEMHAFVVRCMTSVGTPEHHATVLADLLTAADLRGHYSHGLNRLDMYVRDIQTGMTVHDKEPSIVNETAATALVEGNNVLGPVVGKYCIDLAIQKARQAGIGWVSARGSNHFGIAGWYSMQAMEHGMLGMAFTNTSPLMVPTRARKPTLGTNPLSLAAPGKDGDSMVLDMATTAVALGKVELKDRKGLDIPHGWGVDSSGKTCTDPGPVVSTGGLMPLGGTEECSGYKGYGLGMLVEVFCGLLSGASFGPNVRRWKTNDRPANLGQCFIAIDPNAFAPGFADRMSDLMDHCRKLQPAEGESEVLVPGDPERQHIEKCTQLGGIPYHPNQLKYAKDLSVELKVQPPKTL